MGFLLSRRGAESGWRGRGGGPAGRGATGLARRASGGQLPGGAGRSRPPRPRAKPVEAGARQRVPGPQERGAQASGRLPALQAQVPRCSLPGSPARRVPRSPRVGAGAARCAPGEGPGVAAPTGRALLTCAGAALSFPRVRQPPAAALRTPQVLRWSAAP